MKAVNRLTIRTRITFGTLLLAALFFAGAAVVVHGQVQRIQFAATSDLLAADAAPFETAVQREPEEALDRPGEGQLVSVIDPAGAVVMSSLPTALAADISGLAALGEQPVDVSAGGVDYLVRAEPVSTSAGIWVIVSARTEASNRLVLAGLTQGLIIGLAVLTLLFGVASWLLTGAALRPVNRLRASAERLAGSDSNALLPVGPAVDEVSALAVTLNGLIEELRSSAERERQMVSDASHELRTPLAILQSQLELLRTGDRASIDADLHSAEAAVQRLSHLVSNLLELSRLESGTDAATATIPDLAAELAAAVDRGRLPAARTLTTVDYDVAAATGPGSVGMSAHDFGRVVENLVGNAVKAAAGGSVRVRLAVSANTLELEVSDSGPGMPANFLPRAFDRFSQADETRAPGEGSGLGLAIVAAAVRAAAGTVTLANRPEGGLRMVVSLPIT